MKIADVWTWHLRENINPVVFPRDFSLARYPRINSLSEYLTKLEWSYSQYSCYTAVYSEPQKTARLIDTMFVDIDNADKMEDNFNIVKTVHSQYPDTRSNFSANKGFHIYWDFPLIKMDLIPKRSVLNFLVDKGVKDVDEDKLLQWSAMARIPYTYNAKSDRFCVPLTGKMFDFTIKELIEVSTRPFDFDIQGMEPKPNSKVLREMVLYDGMNEDTINTVVISGNDESMTIGWIEELLQKPISDARHRTTWLILAPYLVNVKKMGIDDAKQALFEYLVLCNQIKEIDRDSGNIESLVDYFINYANSTGLRPPRLETLKNNHPDIYRIVIG